MSSNDLLLLVLAMAATTYLLRVSPFILFRKPIRNPRIVAFIQILPYSILAAMVIPDAFSATETKGIPANVSTVSSIAGMLAAFILARLNRSLPTVAAGGVIVAWLAQQLLLS